MSTLRDLFKLASELGLRIKDDGDKRVAPTRALLVRNIIYMDIHIWEDEKSMISTLSHEIAHFICDHQGITSSNSAVVLAYLRKSSVGENEEENEAEEVAATLNIHREIAKIVRSRYPDPIIQDHVLARLLKIDPRLARTQRMMSQENYTFVNNYFAKHKLSAFPPVSEDICKQCPLFPQLAFKTKDGQIRCVLHNFCPTVNNQSGKLP